LLYCDGYSLKQEGRGTDVAAEIIIFITTTITITIILLAGYMQVV
jgi:hypothetical protein